MNTFFQGRKNHPTWLYLFCVSFVLSCAPQNQHSLDTASKNISDSLACEQSQSKIFDAFYEVIDKDKAIPSVNSFKLSLKEKLDLIKNNRSFSGSELKNFEKIENELDNTIDLIFSEYKKNPNLSWKEQIQKIIEYEMGDQSSVDNIQNSQKISQSLSNVNQIAQSLDLDCNSATTPAPDTTLPVVTEPPLAETSIPQMAKAINMVFSTAYQSCRALDLPAMDRSTSNVNGITRLAQNHPDGVGGRRIITDLPSVQKTHYYVRSIASESSCQDVRSNPPIYDYGGEPSVSSSTISFFKDAGTGTEALGVDCSAFISSAIGVAGLRYKPGLDNKPIFIRQSSSKFIDATKSGFTCFENITVNSKQSIKPGDIMGISGHVVSIDTVTNDPFGLSFLKNEKDCNTINYKNFDFTIAQSSPSKNGIGINKFKISDYLDESSATMRNGFVEMGKQACLAKFQNTSIKPKSSSWGFIRHKGTAECLAPRITMVGETCTKKCF